jgi:hypothetical protein
MLGEVPLDGLVHELAIAGSQVEGRAGAGAGAGGDRPAGPDVVAPAGPGCYGPAPRLPDDVRDETGGVATVEILGWLNLPETLTVREDAGQLAERRGCRRTDGDLDGRRGSRRRALPVRLARS